MTSMSVTQAVTLDDLHASHGTFPRVPPVTQIVGEPALSPLVMCCGHSGRYYPEQFVGESKQSLPSLRLSEDCYVDKLVGGYDLGVPLLIATFPRAFCDVNRAPWDLDPDMFKGDIPPFLTTSEKAKAGFGSIPRCVGEGRPIYAKKIPFEIAARRIRHYWLPFHMVLMKYIEAARRKFGFAILLDLHSMPDFDGESTPDFIIGNVYGRSSSHYFYEIIEETLQDKEYYVVRNYPYSGGYITRHYGRPMENIHVIQLEIRRSLYMNTRTYQIRKRRAKTMEILLESVTRNILDFLHHYTPSHLTS